MGLPAASRAAISARTVAIFYGMARPSSSSVTLAGQPKERSSSMQIAILGIDLGKKSGSVVGLDDSGRIVVRRLMHRVSVIKFASSLTPCVVAMEACCGAHHLGRVLRAQGHEVRLMSAEYVRPYVKRQKDDDRDGEAIAEAATRPTMRFVELKAEEQLDMQTLHRVRDRLVGERTALLNQLRAVLLERGIAIPQGRRKLEQRLDAMLGAPEWSGVASRMRSLLQDMRAEWRGGGPRSGAFAEGVGGRGRAQPHGRPPGTSSGPAGLEAAALAAARGDEE